VWYTSCRKVEFYSIRFRTAVRSFHGALNKPFDTTTRMFRKVVKFKTYLLEATQVFAFNFYIQIIRQNEDFSKCQFANLVRQYF
jgi:hypothetical protein